MTSYKIVKQINVNCLKKFETPVLINLAYNRYFTLFGAKFVY